MYASKGETHLKGIIAYTPTPINHGKEEKERAFSLSLSVFSLELRQSKRETQRKRELN